MLISKHELFSDFLVPYDESWVHKLSIHKPFSPESLFVIRQPFQKCIDFFETRGIFAPYESPLQISLILIGLAKQRITNVAQAVYSPGSWDGLGNELRPSDKG